jgi:hypothetical protein
LVAIKVLGVSETSAGTVGHPFLGAWGIKDIIRAIEDPVTTIFYPYRVS